MQTNLFNVSLYGNFAAEQYDHLPSRWHAPLVLDDGALALIRNDDVAPGKELWLFGLEIERSLPCSVLSFGVRSGLNTNKSRYHRLVMDSWSCFDEIVSLGQGKRLTIVFDVDLLAALFDPRPCLTALKRLMLKQDVNCYFVQRKDLAAFARQWTPASFESFLRSSGFEIIASQPHAQYSLFMHARLSVDHYRDYLTTLGLGQALIDADFLLVATEDASLHRTGGIGTYVANVKRLNPRCVVLFAAVDTGVEAGGLNTVIAEQVLGGITHDQMFEGDGLVEAVKLMLYTFPRLTICEFQDYQSIGFRLVQAKKTGGLPPSFTLRVFLHGSLDHLRRGTRTREAATYSPSDVRTVIKDRFIFEQADEAVAPSRYLLELLGDEFGYRFRNARIQRLPFDLGLLQTPPEEVHFEAPELLVFIGKFSEIKGWPDFIESLEVLSESGGFGTIKSVAILAPGHLPSDEKARIEALLPCQHLHLSHAEMIRFLRESRNRALFVVPAGSETYSFVVLELLLSACRFIGYRQGGAVEVVNDAAFLDLFFAEANPTSLARKVKEVANASLAAVTNAILEATKRIWLLQQKVNDSFLATKGVSPNNQASKFDVRWLDEITVVTPVYNTPISFLEDLAESLQASSVLPREWILVNDGSTADYSTKLEEFTRRHTGLLVRTVQQTNRGLAGARNRGLAEVSTRLAYFMDSDDLFMPHTLAHAALAIAVQPTPTLAVSGYPVSFESIERLPRDVTPYRFGHYWKPLGISGARTLAMHQNEFIAASSMVYVPEARRLGGWDESDRATWEDWAFYLKAAWSGASFLLMPEPGYFYRNTPGSMSKTYSAYFGMRRLARNLPVFDRFEANALLGLIQHQPKTEQQNIVRDLESAEIMQARKELEAVYRSSSWRLTSPLRAAKRRMAALKARLICVIRSWR